MHEYKCSCHVNNKSYDFLTLGCSTMTQAFSQFGSWLFDNYRVHIELADGLVIDKVEDE